MININIYSAKYKRIISNNNSYQNKDHVCMYNANGPAVSKTNKESRPLRAKIFNCKNLHKTTKEFRSRGRTLRKG